jgi:hypothetical protein
MAETGSQDLGWAQGWGVVREVFEKLEFVAFFDTPGGCRNRCFWGGGRLSSMLAILQRRVGFPLGEKIATSNPLPGGYAHA